MWRVIVAGILACTVGAADAVASDTLSLAGTISIADDPVWAKKLQLKLTVYDRATGGDPVWLERVKSRVKDGKFEMTAGKQSSLAEVLTSSRDLWLEVTLVGIDKDRYQDVFGPRMPLVTAASGLACGTPGDLSGDAYRLRLGCVSPE